MSRCSALLSLAVGLSCAAAYGGVVNTVIDTTPGGATLDGNVAGGEYAGAVSGGGTGFGGAVGNGSLSVDSDANGIYLGFSNMGDISGNSIRVYFDTKSGGFNDLSDGGGFNDFGDFGRERLSRVASNGLTLPFLADYGWILSPAFGGFQALFELIPGGNNSLNFTGGGVQFASSPNTGSPVGENPSNSTMEYFIPYSNIGMSAGGIADFVVVYGNNSDQDNVFMSDEGFPFQIGTGNPGNGPVVLDDFHRLQTFVPEPASIGLLGFAGLGLLRRRRTH